MTILQLSRVELNSYNQSLVGSVVIGAKNLVENQGSIPATTIGGAGTN
jgi:hypothetical protein